MITAESRCCSGCGCLLPDPPAAAVCPRCARVAVPLHTEWPKGMKRWLFAQFLEQFWAPWAAATEQYRWERLLRGVLAGRTWSNRILTYSADAEECFAVAIREFTHEAPSVASTTRSSNAA